MTTPLIFFSYSRRDEAEKDRLLSHIRAALQPGLANVFSDAGIDAGVDWERRLEAAMDEAKVAVLLITADYLNSEFIIEREVKRLLERSEQEGLHLFPVLAKACPWKRVEWLKKLNVIPRGGRPVWGDNGAHVEEDLAAIADEVADIVEKERSAAPAPAPRPTPPPPPHTEEKVDAAAPPLPRVLLVDDNARFRRSVKNNLGDFVTLVEAESVGEAAKILDGNQDIRVILLDLDLGGKEDGTNLLEHIKDRASYYRAIILTAHPDRLVPERAADYKVFRFLAKVDEDAPREMLWYNVENALSDLKRETAVGAREFSEEIVKLYPTPFLHLYQYLKSYIVPGDALAGQKAMLELLLSFYGITLLCEYLYGTVRNGELDGHVRGRLYKPSLGDWFNIANEVVKRKDQFANTFFLSSFLTFYTGRNKKNINDLINVRNKSAHGPMQATSEIEKVVRKCDELLMSLLRDFQIITDYLMCYTLSVQKLRTGYVYNLKECTGANHRLLNSRRSFNFLLDAEEMHLVNLKTEQYQSLHPFIILETCGDCKQEKIFFYSKFSNGQLHYMSYECGHWIIKDSPEEEFLQLIKLAP